MLHADDPNAKVYFDGGHSDWNSAAQQATVLEAAGVTTDANGVFTNLSGAFGGWTVTWTYPGDQRITNLWSAFYAQTGETVSAHDPFDTNATIAAGTSASFGMQGTYSASDAAPTAFTLTADNGAAATCTTG